MKLLVCGSRHLKSMATYQRVLEKIAQLAPDEVIHGGALGVDCFAEVACGALGIPSRVFPALWVLNGRFAGPIRNQQMLDDKPDLVLAVYPTTGITPGTQDMATRR